MVDNAAPGLCQGYTRVSAQWSYQGASSIIIPGLYQGVRSRVIPGCQLNNYTRVIPGCQVQGYTRVSGPGLYQGASSMVISGWSMLACEAALKIFSAIYNFGLLDTFVNIACHIRPCSPVHGYMGRVHVEYHVCMWIIMCICGLPCIHVDYHVYMWITMYTRGLSCIHVETFFGDNGRFVNLTAYSDFVKYNTFNITFYWVISGSTIAFDALI